MSTTSLRLTDELKARLSAIAARDGKSAHSFILEAIEEKNALEELRGDFHDVANTRLNNIAATGKAIPCSDMRRYLKPGWRVGPTSSDGEKNGR